MRLWAYLQYESSHTFIVHWKVISFIPLNTASYFCYFRHKMNSFSNVYTQVHLKKHNGKLPWKEKSSPQPHGLGASQLGSNVWQGASPWCSPLHNSTFSASLHFWWKFSAKCSWQQNLTWMKTRLEWKLEWIPPKVAPNSYEGLMGAVPHHESRVTIHQDRHLLSLYHFL